MLKRLLDNNGDRDGGLAAIPGTRPPSEEPGTMVRHVFSEVFHVACRCMHKHRQ